MQLVGKGEYKAEKEKNQFLYFLRQIIFEKTRALLLSPNL